MISEVWQVPRSTVYAVRERAETRQRPEAKKRGPKTKLTDSALLEEIRAVLKESDFLGEGHRKVRARLKPKGIYVGKNRVLRLMRENGLLAPVRRGKYPRGDRSHSGRITTDVPNELWGTDATRFYTKDDGWVWFFGAIDHCVTDVVGWHVAKKGDRWAALEPIRQGVRAHMDGYAPRIALGLGLRHDWGPAVHGPPVPERAGLARNPIHAFLRRRTRMQRCGRTLHADAQGGVPVSPRLSEP